MQARGLGFGSFHRSGVMVLSCFFEGSFGGCLVKEPYTLSPKPETLNPKPQTLTLKPLNPKPFDLLRGLDPELRFPLFCD